MPFADKRRGRGSGRNGTRGAADKHIQGTIRRLIPDRGFGFIQADGQKEDIFFHRSSVLEGSFDDFKEGDYVEFEMHRDLRRDRICAINIKPCTEPKKMVAPRPERQRGRIFTGWREALERAERRPTYRKTNPRERASDDAPQQTDNAPEVNETS